MNPTPIDAIFLFPTFRHLFLFRFDPIVQEIRTQNKTKKSTRKLKKSNQSINGGWVHG